jgi:glyoxylase-like metal-dependent hydrolase (beta-lactamase superfamily II)
VYGIHHVRAGLVQVTVPPCAPLGLPYGTPYNVFVLDGPSPTLIDTGHVGGRDALRAALDELGVAPERVGRIALTSARPDAIGNVPLFPNASVVAASAPDSYRAHAAEIVTPVVAIARELVDGPDGHPEWRQEVVDAFVEEAVRGVPEFRTLAVGDGAQVGAAGGRLTARHSPGVDPHATCYVDVARNELFAGATVVPPSTVRVRSPKSYGVSLQAISSLQPDLVLSAHGPVQTSYYAVFRSLNLSVSNLVQNMPFALQGPTPVARIAFNDLGYWPRDLIRFAAWVDRFKVMLDELVQSGVASVEGDGAWARYSMERPSRY